MSKTTEVNNLLDFIERSPSCYHVVSNISEILLNAGYEEIEEYKPWSLKNGKGYFVRRTDSSVIAFFLPKKKPDHFQIIASHSDSPCFKIKENEELVKEGHYVTLNTEKYGGMLMAPWFDRPLSVAGKIQTSNNGTIKTKLVNIDKDILMLPSLAIHMDREANNGHKYSAQKEIIPLFGDENSKGQFMKEVAKSAGISVKDIVATDLFMYPRSKGIIWGAKEEFFSSRALDDLMNVYASISALITEKNTSAINMCCVFDNEEVGSLTKQGADSDFLESVLERIYENLGLSKEDYRIAVAKSFMLSADNGHAVHPNYPDKADPTNRPVLNGGVLLKYNANQKYTTDSITAAIVKELCKKDNIPMQVYVNHSDIAGGSTLGNLSNAHVSLNTADIGVAQLAMHSPYETAGVKDYAYLCRLMKGFYKTKIEKISNSEYRMI